MDAVTLPKYSKDSSALNDGRDVHYYGKDAEQKLRRSSAFLLLFRALSFLFSLAAVIVMGTNHHMVQGTNSKVAWYDYDPYR